MPKEKLFFSQGCDSTSNAITLASYELGMNEYISGTPPEVFIRFQSWLDKTLALLPKSARIFEIGSGFGRDARYMETKGFTVHRSDATQAFVHLLQQEGH